jgi:cell division protein FtsB
MLAQLFHNIQRLVESPLQVFALGAALTLFTLTVDGSLWRFWSLNRGQEQMLERLGQLEEKSKSLEFRIHQAENLTFIERQATDQFDYVREGDLIFIFSE